MYRGFWTTSTCGNHETFHSRQKMQTNFEIVKREMIWGTYGKGGVEHCAGHCLKHKLQWVKLIDRETSHLQAILRTQRQIQGHMCQTVIESILADRGVKPDKFSYEAERKLMDDISVADRRWREEQRQKPS